MCHVIFSEPARLSRVRARNFPVAGLSRVGTDETCTIGAAGAAMVLYPLSGFPAKNKAVTAVIESIRRDGTQKHVIYRMQTHSELDEVLGSHGICAHAAR